MDQDGATKATAALKYGGLHIQTASADERLSVDLEQGGSSRLKNYHQSVSAREEEQMAPVPDADFWTLWTLLGVFRPAEASPGMAEYRASTAQEMERVLLAFLGPSSLNSAVGGFRYPWDARLYARLSQEFLSKMIHPVPASTPEPNTGSSTGPNIRAAIHDS
ncbi:hypothetical protein OC834_005197 [Tilletia horrida]|nr:hypothetical protein OC834_005197 [Tilletia horrida]KAK0537892.1 hypothetical protein OC835_001598 [Tilletia horrida]KAK0559950.1 hypothetical protein OC844_004070 [Tilletia horrida]